MAELAEVHVEAARRVRFTLGLGQHAADEVRDVLHSTTCAHVLKVDGGHIACAKAEVCDLCVSMDKGLKPALRELRVQRSGGPSKRPHGHGAQLIGACSEVPVGSHRPQAASGDTQKARVKVSEPSQARASFGGGESSGPAVEPAGVEVFEQHPPAAGSR